MFALDLFNTDHERRLAEGAVDQLEQRRIDDLAMKMDELVARAKKATTPEARAALVKEFQKCKDERDGYYKVQDECMGYGSLGEQDQIPVGRMQPGTPEYVAARNRSVKYADPKPNYAGGHKTGGPATVGYKKTTNKPLVPSELEVAEAGIGQDVVNKQAKMARLNQPVKAGTDVVSPQQRVNPNPNKGIVGHAADWLRGRGGPGKEGPTYEDLDEAAEDSKISIAKYVYAQIIKALEGNLQFDTIYWPQGTMQGPQLEATLSRNQMHFLIQRLVNMSREQRKQFTYKVLADRNATLQWLTSKKIKTAPTMPQPEVQAGQMNLNLPKPVGEDRGQKKNSDKTIAPQSPEVDRYLTKVRRASPNATSDLEAIAKDELEKQARVNKNIDDLEQVNARQDATLKKAMTLDRQQGNEIDDVERQINQLSQRVQSIKTAKPVAGQPPRTEPQPQVATPAVVPTSTATKVKSDEPANQPTTVNIPQPIYIPEPVTAKDQKIYNKVQDLETELKNKIDAMASWNAVAQKDPQANNELEALRKEVERTRTEIQRQVKKLTKQVKKHTTSLPAPNQAPAKDLGTVRQVAPTPQLGQTPTDAGELGQQIGRRAQANKQAKYGKKPTAATQTDLDVIDVGQASDYLSRLRKRGRTATTVEPQQAELQIEEGTAEQFGQAVRQADQTGRKLERDPEWRRLQQQKTQREKNKLRSQAGYGNDADEFGDITNMNETTKKLQQGDPITVTAPNEFEGATGEIYDFSPSRTFVIVDLYNHGKHSMHLSDVEYNQYAADQDDDEDDWYDDEELDEGAMSELDIERQDLDRMTDQQFLKAYGISKEFWKYKNQDLLKKPRRRPMSAQLARSPVGQKMNTMYGSNCPGCGRSTNPDRCVCESMVNPQFIIAQVTKILATEARRMTNAPMAQLLAPVMKQYNLTLHQIDGMVPGGLRKAAGEYGIMMKEGYQDFNKVEPYAVCLAGKPVKKFDYYEDARRFHDNWKKKLYREGNKEKADKITLMPLNLDEAEMTPDEIRTRVGKNIPRIMKNMIRDYSTMDDNSFNQAHGMTKQQFDQQLSPEARAYYMKEAANPAQQAAIAIAMKKAGKKSKHMNEAGERIDPILIKALNNMPDGLATHGEVRNAAYDAYAMELGKMRMKSEYGTTQVYIPQLMTLYKDKYGLTFNEEQKPGFGEFPPKQEITIVPPKKLKSGETYQDRNKYWQSQGQAPIYKTNETKADPTGSWVVYGGNKVMKFKTHTGAKAYAEKNGGKVASSEFYADKIQGVKEAQTDYQKRRQRERDVDAGRPVKALPKNPQTDYARKRAQDKKNMELGEGLMKEPTNRKEYLDQRDKLFRMMAVDSNPANKQIIKQALQDLEARYGNLKNTVKEEFSTDSEAVERAILNRIMVAHTDLLMKFGPEKVMQAAEEVAYNVGDVDEIGTSDVSAYVAQVKQILGVPTELDEKWSQKYKSSINCANPKGFSQKAHCAGKKK